jgi:hypothetical protein
MAISDIIERTAAREPTLTVYGGAEGAEAGVDRLRDFFEGVTVERDTNPGIVVQFASPVPEREAVAISTREEFDGDYVLVNPAFEVIGTVAPEDLSVPEFVVQIDEATFSVAAGTKSLLNAMSRHIEALALRCDEGTLATGVQELSRLRDEPRTFETYRRLGESAVDTSVLGLPDVDGLDLDVRVRGVDDEEVAASWFVVFHTEGGGGAALVASEVDPGTYRGFWTFESALVDEVAEYLEGSYGL